MPSSTGMQEDLWSYKSIQLKFEEPDVLFYRVVGTEPVDADSVRWLTRTSQGLQRQVSHLYVLVELGFRNRLSQGAREEFKSHKTEASTLVLFGGNAAARALAQIILRGLSLLGKMKVPITYHPDEQQAREWVH